jgi:septum formation protein
MRRLILASSSPYRKALLMRLGIPFETVSPEVDETRRAEEQPLDLVIRLSELKAKVFMDRYPGALIIGSDQCAVVDGEILGKPGGFKQALQQLKKVSGKAVDFHTGICLLDTDSGEIQTDDVIYKVHFRLLTNAQLSNYLHKEKPYNCAASIRSDNLGIALFERMEGDDPNALVGLPLIRLVSMLEKAGCPAL